MLILLVLFYLMQGSHMRRGEGAHDNVNKMGNAVGIMGILLTVLAMIWSFALVVKMRDARNIWFDASSIYVSRSNILLSWYNSITAPDKVIPISGEAARDQELCFGNQYVTQADAHSFDSYEKLITALGPGSKGVDQTYLLSTGQTTEPIFGTMKDQQKQSLAYYRFAYCTKAYMADILSNKHWNDGTLSFLSPQAQANLAAQPPKSCMPDDHSTPDTTYCLTPGWPLQQQTCGQVNPCYMALQQTIAAQCLLYDDHVTFKLTRHKMGVLDAFGLQGYQVAPPVQ